MKPLALWRSLFNRVIALAKERGLKFVLNYALFYLTYGAKNSLIIRLLFTFASYPTSLEIEVTTRCNLKCAMCEHTYWQEPSVDMSYEKFKMIVDQFPKLRWIGLTGIGQSFLNKDFLRMLELVKSRGAYVELYDSFCFLNEKNSGALVELGIEKIYASIDAATKETYEKIRKGSKFERVINNVTNLIDIRNQKGLFFPEIHFHYIISKLNFHEIRPFVRLVHSIDKSGRVGVKFTRLLHYFDEVQDLFIEVPKETIEETNRLAARLNVPISWSTDIPQKKPRISKCTEWTMPFIFVTGHVIPCCAGNEANSRYFQKEHSLGNVFDQSFKEIWNSKKYKDFRSKLRKGKVPSCCADCSIYNIGKTK